jgi:hypothetical protein
VGLGDSLQIFSAASDNAVEVLEEEKLTTTHRKLDNSDSDIKRISLQRSFLGLKL